MAYGLAARLSSLMSGRTTLRPGTPRVLTAAMPLRRVMLGLMVVAVVAVGCVRAAVPRLGAGADLASVRSIEHALERGHDRVRALMAAPLEIRAVTKLYEGEPGGTARVLLVDTDQGEKLAKVSYVRTVASRMVPWILQDEASRAGIAPALHKIIEGEDLAALVRGHTIFHGLTSPWTHSPQSPPISMVVMDIVRDGFSFLQWERSRRSLGGYSPALVPIWADHLRRIEAYMNRHNIQMADEQFLIQPDGNVMVIDFDHYTFVDSRSRRWAYKSVTDYPDVDYWRVPSSDAKLNDIEPTVRKLAKLFDARLTQ